MDTDPFSHYTVTNGTPVDTQSHKSYYTVTSLTGGPISLTVAVASRSEPLYVLKVVKTTIVSWTERYLSQ